MMVRSIAGNEYETCGCELFLGRVGMVDPLFYAVWTSHFDSPKNSSPITNTFTRSICQNSTTSDLLQDRLIQFFTKKKRKEKNKEKKLLYFFCCIIYFTCTER